MRFKNRVAMVTGGSSGIGRATALAFAREGAVVAIGDVNHEGSEETVRMIRESGGESQFIHCDVADAESVRRMVETIVQDYGRLDFGFNNAGIEGTPAPTGEYPIDIWNRVIAINLTGVWYCMRYQIGQMLKQGGGAIVNNASILGVVGFASAPAYVAAKHGVLGLTKTAAIEYAARGIRVNAVCPAFIETPMLERGGITSDPEMRAVMEGLHPIGRLGRPGEISGAVLWLCSDEASFVTGHPMLIDGGYVAR